MQPFQVDSTYFYLLEFIKITNLKIKLYKNRQYLRA